MTLNGYLPNIGLRHANRFNPYNLSCDLMEPFRAIVDRAVIKTNPIEFGKEEKKELLSLLSSAIYIAGTSAVFADDREP